MKKIILLIYLILFTLIVFAQTEGMNYQAVILDKNEHEIPGVDVTGNFLSNGEISIRFTFYNQSDGLVYQEIHSTTTDAFGMINVIIGMGEITSESPIVFNEIDWDGSPKDLSVELMYDDQDYTELSRQAMLFLPYAYHRNITATGTLTVDLEALLNSDLTVLGDAFFNGNTTFGDIVVTNFSDLQGDVQVGGNLSTAGPSNFNGQVTINSGTTGSENSYDSYGLRVEGTEQGIAVQLDGTRAASKNFMSFMDGTGTIHGRIEGQTYSELINSYRFIWDVVMAGLETALIAAEGAACFAQLDWGESGVMAAAYITTSAQWVELTAYQELNVGVSFSSGGADYAEWLEREEFMLSFQPGDVVGIHAGKISHNTKNAHQVLVISTNPIVLGNQPEKGQENRYERVAFLGQVPVKVIGKVNEGDYILPSGNNDGLAIALSPKLTPTNRYSEIIGIAWEAGSHESVNTVNVAIGLNTNDLANKVSSLESDLDLLRAEIEEIKSLIIDGSTSEFKKDPSPKMVLESAKMTSTLNYSRTVMSDEEFELWLENYGYVFKEIMSKVKKDLINKGAKYDQYDDIIKILDSPEQALREMRDGEYLESLWLNFEKRILEEE